MQQPIQKILDQKLLRAIIVVANPNSIILQIVFRWMELTKEPVSTLQESPWTAPPWATPLSIRATKHPKVNLTWWWRRARIRMVVVRRWVLRWRRNRLWNRELTSEVRNPIVARKNYTLLNHQSIRFIAMLKALFSIRKMSLWGSKSTIRQPMASKKGKSHTSEWVVTMPQARNQT